MNRQARLAVIALCVFGILFLDGANVLPGFDGIFLCDGGGTPGQSLFYQVFKKTTDFGRMPVVKTWVVVDGNTKSINDGWFKVSMTPKAPFEDTPATYPRQVVRALLRRWPRRNQKVESRGASYAAYCQVRNCGR